MNTCKAILLSILISNQVIIGQDLINTKRIEYRGGIITFEVPKNWQEEYNEEGGAAFYEDVENSGTLFLNLITVESPNPVSKKSTIELLKPISKNEEVKVLANQNVIKHFNYRSEENGINLIIFWWSLAQIIEPNKGRIANFSYVIPASIQNEKTVVKQVEFLNRKIEAAIFSEE